MTIRCIAFDLDDTLWECRPVIERAEQRFYAWLQEHYPRIPQQYAPGELIGKRIAYMKQFPELLHDLTQLRKNWLAHLAEETGHSRELVEPGFEVFWLARNEVAFFAGALDIIQSLAERFITGVISNGNADVRHIGVGHLFQFTQSAAEAGVAKPHPGIFRRALDKAGVEPWQAVYVGDDPVRDVLGAAGAGMRTVWFNPSGQAWEEEGREPDAEIRNLSELESVLAAL